MRSRTSRWPEGQCRPASLTQVSFFLPRVRIVLRWSVWCPSLLHGPGLVLHRGRRELLLIIVPGGCTLVLCRSSCGRCVFHEQCSAEVHKSSRCCWGRGLAGTTLIYHTQGGACRATGSKESPPARNTAQIYLVCDPNAVDPTPSVLAERLEQCEVDLLLKTTAVCNYRCFNVSLSVACVILLLLGAAPL